MSRICLRELVYSWTRYFFSFSGVILVGTLLATEVKALDLERLTRLLVPTYIAHQFANVCVARDPDFLFGIDDKHGSLAAHVQHVKAEIIADIPEQDARAILARAAETARSIALNEVIPKALTFDLRGPIRAMRLR